MVSFKNLLWLTTLTALVSALVVQQNRLESLEEEYSKRYDAQHFGSYTAIDGGRLVSLAEVYVNRESDEEFSKLLHGELLYCVICCAQYECTIDSKEGSGHSILLGSKALDLLGCTEYSEFIQMARECDTLGEPRFYPEIYCISSIEYARLRLFLERALSGDTTRQRGDRAD